MHRIRFCGFSLLELLVAIVVLALMGAIAIPAFESFVLRNRALALADQLQSELAHARFVSAVSDRDVDVCGSSDGRSCDGGWGRGWLLYMPREERLIRAHRLDTKREQLVWQGFSKAIRFRSNGTAPLGNGSFYICDQRSKSVIWQLVVNRQGRVKRLPGEVEQDHCG